MRLSRIRALWIASPGGALPPVPSGSEEREREFTLPSSSEKTKKKKKREKKEAAAAGH